jgi:hypothetical protein
VVQQKTSRPVQFEITELTRTALADWVRLSGVKSDDFLFPSRVRVSPHLSTRQHARIVDSWVEEIGLDPAAYGTHSIRRTKPSLIYRRTKNLRAVQLFLGHTKLESTVRYLGIEVEDALELAEQTEAQQRARQVGLIANRGTSGSPDPAALRKYRSFVDGLANASHRPASDDLTLSSVPGSGLILLAFGTTVAYDHF